MHRIDLLHVLAALALIIMGALGYGFYLYVQWWLTWPLWVQIVVGVGGTIPLYISYHKQREVMKQIEERMYLQLPSFLMDNRKKED